MIIFYGILEHFYDILWHIMVYYGILWYIVVNFYGAFGTLWYIMVYCGIL